MVRLEEVPDEEILRQQARQQAAAAGAGAGAGGDSDSEWEEDADASDAESDDSDVSERGLVLHDETVWERIAALKDIVPPSTRQAIANAVSTTSSYALFGGQIVGKLGWVLTTSALLVGLPFALAVEDESRIVAQEKEMMGQGVGAQTVSNPPLPSPSRVLTLSLSLSRSLSVLRCSHPPPRASSSSSSSQP